MNEQNILRQIKNRYPEAEVEINTVLKNNGVTKRGITIRTKESNVTPNIYFEDLEGTDEEIIEQIVDIYERSKISEDYDLNEFFDNFENYVSARLVSAVTDVSDLVNIKFGEDFYEIFAIEIDCELGNGAIKITKDLAENKLETDAFELHKYAMKNMHPRLTSMFDELKDVLANPEAIAEDELGHQMLVLSNESKNYGAASVLNKEVMQKAQELIGDFVIIPSSVHELIIVPKTDDISPALLTQMICEVNDTQVAKEEQLGCVPYIYVNEELQAWV